MLFAKIHIILETSSWFLII